jgi:hypothetical protein
MRRRKLHVWVEEVRTYGSHRSRCENCGLVRDRRFAYGSHWIEYDRNGVTIARDKAPPCEPPTIDLMKALDDSLRAEAEAAK